MTAPAPEITRLEFEAQRLALGWRAVRLAAGHDKERPILDRTVCVELAETGARLVATDGYMLLHAWVPTVGSQYADGHPVDKAPHSRTIVAQDTYGRGVSLMAHLANLTQNLDDDDPQPTVALDVVSEEADQAGFAGLENRCLEITTDSERLLLGTVEADYPDWRSLLAGFTVQTTDVIALHSARLDAVARLGKLTGGIVKWRFGGSEKMALIETTLPKIEGAVMPTRVFEPDPPETEGDKS